MPNSSINNAMGNMVLQAGSELPPGRAMTAPNNEVVRQFTGILESNTSEAGIELPTDNLDSHTPDTRFHRPEHPRHQEPLQNQDGNQQNNPDNNLQNSNRDDANQQESNQRDGHHHPQRHHLQHHISQEAALLADQADRAAADQVDQDSDSAGGGGGLMRQSGLGGSQSSGGDVSLMEMYRDNEQHLSLRDNVTSGNQQAVSFNNSPADQKHEIPVVLQHPAPPHLMPLMLFNRWAENGAGKGNGEGVVSGRASPYSYARTVFGFLLVFFLLFSFIGFQLLLKLKNDMEEDMQDLVDIHQLQAETAAQEDLLSAVQEQQELRHSILAQLQDSAIVVVSGEYLIGLVYQRDVTPLPVILHRERLHEASDIYQYARQHNIPVFRDDKLARELWQKGEVDQFVPKSTSTPIARLFVKAAYLRSKSDTGEALIEAQ